MTEQLPQLLAPCRLWAKCLFGCALAIIIGSMGFVSANAFAKAPVEVDCRADDGRCPELIIAGDPPAEAPDYGLAPIRGYGDPSLRQDRQTGALWLSYSWVSTLVAPGSKPGKPIIDIGVGIHFARSGDGGRSFQFIRKIWTSDPEINEGTDGYSEHEVSTISRAGRAGRCSTCAISTRAATATISKPTAFISSLWRMLTWRDSLRVLPSGLAGP